MVREMRWDGLEDLFDFDIEPLAKHQQTASRTNTEIQNTHTLTVYTIHKYLDSNCKNLNGKELNPNPKYNKCHLTVYKRASMS